MAMAKKLDTFIFRDRFELAPEAVSEEAHASAVRRSEVMGWVDISIRPSSSPVTIDGEYKCYSFDIWGIEGDALSPPQTGDDTDASSRSSGLAARDAAP